MEYWSRVIVEWINCLQLDNVQISDIEQLQEISNFYSQLIKKLRGANGRENTDESIKISKFIEEEYPDLIIDKNYVDIVAENVYRISLLLLSASQNEEFHKPMYSLKNDSQIVIKQFLEQILPYGKELTFDILRESIAELGDSALKTPPKTPRDRPLKNFLTSPAAQSAYRHKILNQYNRELRQCKAELETEIFERMDLQEDVKKLEDKVQNLQKQLKKKNDELKTLRIENTYAKTPKSCQKGKNSNNIEEYLKKEIEDLETHNAKLQLEITQLEEKQENLSRRLASKERLSTALNVKVNEYENKMVSLSSQLELKNHEFLDLRMQNEELRAHINKIQRNSLDADQSFEIENLSNSHLPRPSTPELNVSEAASSIIDIQLKEAHEESAKLKNKLDIINKKLDETIQECQEFKNLNDLLNEKVSSLDELKMALEITEDKLEKRQCQINILEMEKKSLTDDMEKLKEAITAKQVVLKEMGENNNKLESQLSSVKKELNNLKISLDTTEDSLAQTVASKEVLEMKLTVTENKMLTLEESLRTYTQKHEKIRKDLESNIKELESNISGHLEKEQIFEEVIKQKNEDLENLSKDLEDRNLQIDELKNKISELDERAENSKEEIRKLEDSISAHLQEEQKLQEIIKQKNGVLEQLSKKLDDKNSEIDSLNTKISELRETMNDSEGKINSLEVNMTMLIEEKKQVEESVEQRNLELKELIKQLDDKNSENDLLKIKLSQMEEIKQNTDDKNRNLEDNILALSEDKRRLERLVEQKCDDVKILAENLNDEFVENCTLKTKISQLEEIKQTAEEKVRNLEENITEYLKDKDELEKIIEQKNHNMQKLSEELDEKNSEIHLLVAKITQMEGIMKNSEEKMNILGDDIFKHSKDKQNLEKMLKQNLKELNILSEEFKAKNEEVITLKSKLSELEDRINSNELILSAAETKICELNELREELQSQLVNEREKNAILMDNRRELECKIDEMMKFDERKEAAAKEKIQELYSRCEMLTSDLSATKSEIILHNSKAKELISERDLLQNKINDVSRELENKNMELKEMELQVEELKRIQERTTTSYQERENSSNEIINSLEKKLLTAQSTCETLKLEKKLQEESLGIVSSKLEQLTKEKVESELKLKELIVNLQEVRASQEGVIQAQSKALIDKTLELELFEKEHKEMKNTLEAEIHQYKTYNQEKISECKSLKQTNEDYSIKIHQLEVNLNTETEDLKVIKKKYNSLMNDIEVSKSSNDNYLKTIEELEINLNSEKDKLQILQGKYDSLINNLEEEKKNSEATLSEKIRNNDELLEKIDKIKSKWEKRNEYLSRLVQEKKSLQDLYEQVITSRHELEESFVNTRQSWSSILKNFQDVFTEHSSPCDELKQLEAKKAEIEILLGDFNDSQSKCSKSLVKVLQRIFLWTEKKLEQVYISPLDSIEFNEINIDLSDENSILEAEIEKKKSMSEDFELIKSKIDEFSHAFNSYETNMKSGILKREQSTEEKLQIQLDKITKEKKELKDKLDAVRVRSAKMEKTFDELRNENKKLKAEVSSISSEHKSEIERLTTLTEELQSQVEQLEKKGKELSTETKENNVDFRMKEVHREYEQKLEKIKQKMKKAYNEQIEKLSNEQKKAMETKVSELQAKMDQQCKKCTEDLARYKAHVSELSSQMWSVGEKLLTEQQEKETIKQRLRDLQHKYNTAINELNYSFSNNRHQSSSKTLEGTFSHDQSDVSARPNFRAVQLIEEETTTTRRHSVKSIQAMGNAFNAEDEEGEVFDNIYLTDLKEGKFRSIEPASDFDRLSELRMRNSLCLPHLRSAYAVETHLHPLAITEEDIKSGGTSEDVFNDSLSQSLLPGQKVKKKDRTQTSYKRPGPPTPSKNGGRLSLQGNELKSPNSRILRDRNSERRTTATPKRLKNLFGTTLSRRQDENTPATPKGRRLSNMFRKSKAVEKS